MLSRLKGSTWESFVSCYPITFPKARSWVASLGRVTGHGERLEKGGPDQLAWGHTMGCK